MENEVSKKINWFKYFVKLDRLAAWTLLVVIILYGITGYGMTKGLISQEIARNLHFGLLGVIGLTAFVIHTSWAIHLTLKRNQLWNIFTKISLWAVYIFLILFFCFVQFFYQTNKNYIVKEVNASTLATSSELVSLKTLFSAQTIKTYNGLNGQPAYVAVDGLVYDVSSLFRNGNHQGYKAGQDLSAAFHGQHPSSFLNGYQVVGTYK